MARLAHRIERRAALGLLAAAAAVPVALAEQHARIIAVSRERLLREVAHARAARQAENAATARLQALIDQATSDFATEEARLAEIRGDLAEAEFQRQAADFDRRIRAARREAQERAALLQRSFQEVRARIVAALPPVLERLRQEEGAEVVLNADQILAAGEGIDRTDRAVAMFDETVPEIALPELDLWDPLLPAEAPAPADGDPVQQQ